MSLQDDIFDVQHALEGKPEAESFDRVYTALGQFEEDADNLRRLLNDMGAGIRAARIIAGLGV